VDGTFGTGTIDDVIDAIPVHGGCGVFGVLMAGFFATQNNYAGAYYEDRAQHCAGVFYGG
jgi:Amt family ammonium transporter